MFGDSGWCEARMQLQRRRLQDWLERVRRPVVVELGAGTAIPSVRHFGHQMISLYGGRMVRINPREWQVPSTADVGIAVGALAGLRLIDQALNQTLEESSS